MPIRFFDERNNLKPTRDEDEREGNVGKAGQRRGDDSRCVHFRWRKEGGGKGKSPGLPGLSKGAPQAPNWALARGIALADIYEKRDVIG